jgi:hypothetical protein
MKMVWILLFGVITSCDDPKTTKLTYMPDMATGPQITPQRNYLEPPVHSVPVNGIFYSKTSTESESILTNSLIGAVGEDFHLANGKKLFETYCSVCHGPDFKGGSTMKDKMPPPPDLTTEIYKDRKDGFYLHTMTFGSTSGVMPGYGHATSMQEREQILLYIRLLQNQ